MHLFQRMFIGFQEVEHVSRSNQHMAQAQKTKVAELSIKCPIKDPEIKIDRVGTRNVQVFKVCQ